VPSGRVPVRGGLPQSRPFLKTGITRRLGGWLGTPPPERGRSTRPSRMFPTWPKLYPPKSARADFGWRSGGGRDPHPIPPLLKGREEIAAPSAPHAADGGRAEAG